MRSTGIQVEMTLRRKYVVHRASLRGRRRGTGDLRAAEDIDGGWKILRDQSRKRKVRTDCRQEDLKLRGERETERDRQRLGSRHARKKVDRVRSEKVSQE